MYEFIEKLKKKPESYRRRFALGVSGGITAMLFVVWASVIFPTTNRAILATNSDSEEEQKEQTPITTLSSGVAQAYAALKASLSKVSTDSVNVQEEYNKMKGQVENGEFDILPQGNNNPQE
jgi:hypothetical protein